MISIQKERDGLSWDGLTWVGKMLWDDSGTGWKRDGLSRIHYYHLLPCLQHPWAMGNLLSYFANNGTFRYLDWILYFPNLRISLHIPWYGNRIHSVPVSLNCHTYDPLLSVNLILNDSITPFFYSSKYLMAPFFSFPGTHLPLFFFTVMHIYPMTHLFLFLFFQTHL